MKERAKYEWRGAAIVLALFAALCLMILCVQGLDDRLPKEQGAQAYLSVGFSDPTGKMFVPLSQGGCSHGYADGSIWRSVSRMPLTRHSAVKNDMITAAEEDSPPIGSVPSITPHSPTASVKRFDSAQVAPRR